MRTFQLELQPRAKTWSLKKSGKSYGTDPCTLQALRQDQSECWISLSKESQNHKNTKIGKGLQGHPVQPSTDHQ